MYKVDITIEFDEEPTEADIFAYLLAEIKTKSLRYDIEEI